MQDTRRRTLRGVDDHALSVLEFPALVDRVAGASVTERGEELARALVPSPDPAVVHARQALTGEALALLDAAAEPRLGGIADIRERAAHAGRGGTLLPGDLRAVALAVAVALDARRDLDGELAPLLAAILAPIDPGLGSVRDAIDRCVEEDGSDLRDDASPELRRLRAELRSGRARIAGELARAAEGIREHLQETFLTEREGRPVLAVKASARRSVPGIVHDASTSGQTVFVEPFAVVELSNRLAEAAGAEREEVERILRELSARVGDRAAGLETLVEVTAAVDLAVACGAVSRRWGGAQVVVGDEVRLVGARHPLLDPATAVPIDLDLGGLRALVVSGPNTGGKTVALKTLGVAALLHQAGLRPPADEAALPVFDRVLAAIGDEQSIEMSLSTFSAHLRTIVSILGTATDRSLVLLDELAAGTDPDEGSALAQALVARLAGQARLTVVTTHYPELKEWASATDDVVNAATAFDLDTGEPVYEVTLGRPGSSHALRVAERLGLDPAVVADARGRVAPERLRAAALLADAETAERAATESLSDAQQAAAQARARERELAAEVERVRASAAKEREQALERAERDLAGARAELEQLREEIRAARRRERQRQQAPEAERARDRHLGEATDRSRRAESSLRALREPLPLQAPLAEGDPVEAPDLGIRGTLAEIKGDEAEVVAVGGTRVRVPLARLRPGREREEAPPPVRILATAPSGLSDEVDVRGLRAQEARERVRAYVDDAALAGIDTVRVVHGRGTGAVRAAVRDELARHPLVGKTEPDSHDGATLAHLA
jgi:DNA mismatch repair protein MutS2